MQRTVLMYTLIEQSVIKINFDFEIMILSMHCSKVQNFEHASQGAYSTSDAYSLLSTSVEWS